MGNVSTIILGIIIVILFGYLTKKTNESNRKQKIVRTTFLVVAFILFFVVLVLGNVYKGVVLLGVFGLGTHLVIKNYGAENKGERGERMKKEERGSRKRTNIVVMVVAVLMISIGMVKGNGEVRVDTSNADSEQVEEEEKEEDKERKKEDSEQGNKEEESGEEEKTEELKGELGQLKVHYIDVGQADATLLELTGAEEDVTILIDTGDWNQTDAIDYLDKQNVDEIDILVGTHPHADHIGQMDKVLDSIEVEEVWMSGDESSSQLYEKVITSIEDSGVDYVEPRAGEELSIGNIDMEIIAPKGIGKGLNDGSVSMRMEYGEVSFLFTGDAETSAEKGMLERGHELKSDIMKLGHHGSETSTIPEFFDKVEPEVAIYSAAETSKYDHPDASVVNRVLDAGVELYGTDVNGTVVLTTDGVTYDIEEEKKGSMDENKDKGGNKGTEDVRDDEVKKDDENKKDWMVDGEKEETKEDKKDKEEEKKRVEDNEKDITITKEDGCVDINNATKTELQELASVGLKKAELIILNRPYETVDELVHINGIGEASIEKIKEQGYVCE